MEKYINHDLGLITEEQEDQYKKHQKARFYGNIDLATHKNKFIGDRTTYRDNHYQKHSPIIDVQNQYTKVRDYDRQSSIQRQAIANEQHQKMHMKALYKMGKEGIIDLEEQERAKQNQIQSGYISEQKSNFSKANLEKAYGVTGQANLKEMQSIVAKGRS